MKKAALITGVLLASVSGNAVAQNAAMPTKSLGLTQDAWNAKIRQRGESRTNPGYIRYIYNPADVFPVRTRESMITTIKLPADEKLTQAFAGDDQGFQVGIPTPNSIAIKALYPGVDTNIVAYTEDGKVFTFYVRSEGYNSKTISDFLVDVVFPGEGVIEGGAMAPDGAVSPERQGKIDSTYPATAAERIRDPYGSQVLDKREKYRDYAEWTDFNPDTVVEGDLGIYVPVKQAGGTVPYRVFHDDRFTYIDYGPNASQMTEWPAPVIVIQGVEGPIGFRTTGPGGRLMVLEALGDFVLRNGQRVIVIKKRSEVSSKDRTLIEYPVASSAPMSGASDLPPGRPGLLVSRPKTAVPDATKPATAFGEAPTKIVPLPTRRPIEGVSPAKSATTVVGVTEIKAPAPASPVRVTTATSAVAHAAYDVSALNAPLPAAKRNPAADAASGVALGANVAGARVVTTQSLPAVTANNIVTAAAGSLKPLTDASALSGYRVVVGRGTPPELEDKWKSYKVQYFAVLNGKRMTVVPTDNGASALSISPVGSIAEGMKICTAITDGTECTVKNAR